MPATTEQVITQPLNLENAGQAGSFGIVNRDPVASITVSLQTDAGEQIFTLVHQGDSCSWDLASAQHVVVSSSVYPASILILASGLTGVSLDAAQYVIPTSPVPGVHKDVTITTATTTTLWTPATGRRFVIEHLEISTDTAMRIAVVDNADSAGQRLAVGWFASNGGLVDNAPKYSGAVDRVLKVVTGGAGNVFVAVDGYEST